QYHIFLPYSPRLQFLFYSTIITEKAEKEVGIRNSNLFSSSDRAYDYFKILIVMVRRPHLFACATDEKWRSILLPLMAPPVSPAIAMPYPGISTIVPSGITLGSTAITIGFTRRSIPVAV